MLYFNNNHSLKKNTLHTRRKRYTTVCKRTKRQTSVLQTVGWCLQTFASGRDITPTFMVPPITLWNVPVAQHLREHTTWKWDVYYIQLQRPFGCLCVYRYPPPPCSTRPSDCDNIWHAYTDRYGTHSQLKKTFTHPHPRGLRGILAGQKFKSPGNVTNFPENQ